MKYIGEVSNVSVVINRKGEVKMEINDFSDKQYKKMKKIQKAYCDYVNFGDERYFQELLKLTDAMCTKWVRDHLEEKGCYNDEVEGEALCNARVGVWKAANSGKIACDSNSEEFAKYAYGIYKISAQDAVRKFERRKKKTGEVVYSLERMRETGKDISVGTEGSYIVEQKGVSNTVKPVEIEKKDSLLVEERRKVYATFQEMYFKSLMETTESPEKAITLMYVRILPHVLDEVRDSISSSVTWARKRIGENTIGYLTYDSEDNMQQQGFTDFNWGIGYTGQLDKEVLLKDEKCIVRDVRFLEAYDKGRNLEHMDRDMHYSVQKATFESLKDLKEFIFLAKQYVDKTDRMYGLIGGVKR